MFFPFLRFNFFYYKFWNFIIFLIWICVWSESYWSQHDLVLKVQWQHLKTTTKNYGQTKFGQQCDGSVMGKRHKRQTPTGDHRLSLNGMMWPFNRQPFGRSAVEKRFTMPLIPVLVELQNDVSVLLNCSYWKHGQSRPLKLLFRIKQGLPD